MLGIPGTGSHLYVTGVQPEWDTKENLSLQFMFKSAADEDKALQANTTGISVTIENRGTDGQVRSEWTSVYICVDGQEDKLSIFGEDGTFVGGRPARRLKVYKAVFFQKGARTRSTKTSRTSRWSTERSSARTASRCMTMEI